MPLLGQKLMNSSIHSPLLVREAHGLSACQQTAQVLLWDQNLAKRSVHFPLLVRGLVLLDASRERLLTCCCRTRI